MIDAELLIMTLELVAVFLALCPFIVQDTRDAEALLMAVATAAQRLRCHGSEVEDSTAPVPGRDIQISITMLRIIQCAHMFDTSRRANHPAPKAPSQPARD